MTIEFDNSKKVRAPRENSIFRGHEQAEFILKKAFDSNRLAHAWLITGSKGIGKATLAYRFVRYVLSDSDKAILDAGLPGLFEEEILPEKETHVSGKGPLYIAPANPVFKKVATGSHVDFMSVERTINEKNGKLRTEIVVDDVRSVGSFFNFTAGEGGWRVVVIDCADELNSNAANAVLKVLEEPPPKTLLLLISHNPGQLLGTIRSRCRKLHLKPLENEYVASLVRSWNLDIEEASVKTLITLADGSPGRALALAGDGGLGLYQEMISLLGTLPKLDIEALHTFSGRLGKPGSEEAFVMISELFRSWMSRMILAKGKDKSGFMILTEPEKIFMDQFSEIVSLDRWFELWEKINRLLSKTNKINLDRKQVILNVFLALENSVQS
jgi:DNA polymerase-3 subunit delta'